VSPHHSKQHDSPAAFRGEPDLLPIIQQHIAPGTEIHTDCWKVYDHLNQHGYLHKTVNHSDPDDPFISPEGIHTNRIESQWRPGKAHFRKIHIQSICDGCQKKLSAVRFKPIEEHKEPTKEETKAIRAARIRIHKARDICEPCKDLEENFAEKLVEYQWHRENKRLKRDPMEEVLGCIRRAFPKE
jgi:hypothetical protein